MNENELAAFATRKSVYNKIANYLFCPGHQAGWPKGQWFIRALGFKADNLEHYRMLADQIIFDQSLATVSKLTTWCRDLNKNIQ